MNNKLNILCLALLSLITCSTQPKDAVHVSICIEFANNTVIDESIRQELFEHALQSVHEICEVASCEVKLNIKQTKSELEIDSEVVSTCENDELVRTLNNHLVCKLLTFVDACNQHAVEEGYDITFHIDTTNDEIALVIVCGELEPKPTYWQSVKNTVSVAANAVTTKATNAGVFMKDVTQAGAQKVSNAAYVVKEKTKHGIHSVAEKVSDITA